MGRFVVLEGLDGAGTTTQAERLVDRLRAEGRGVVGTREPTDGPVGLIIRATLRGEAGAPPPTALPWLFAADRAVHVQTTVAEALARGAWVVSDRYLPSSLAYQSVDHPLDHVDALNRTFRVPDLVVYLDVPVSTCVERVSARGGAVELFEERQALEVISARYDAVRTLLTGRGEPWTVVDGDAPVDAVADAVWRAVAAL